jgi:hypothetical protein
MSKLKNLKNTAPAAESTAPAAPANTAAPVEKTKRAVPEGFGKKRTPEQIAAHDALVAKIKSAFTGEPSGVTVKKIIEKLPGLDLPAQKLRQILRNDLKCVRTQVGTSVEKVYNLPA